MTSSPWRKSSAVALGTDRQTRRVHCRQRSRSRLQADARPRLVALDVYARLVQEHRFIRAETSHNDCNDISSARKATLGMADAAVSLSPLGVKPLINEIEIFTAVVDLAVTVTNRLPTFDYRDGFPPSVPHSCQRLCQMYGGIGVMANPE